MESPPPRKAGDTFRAFTLVEVLIVLAILSVLFGTLVGVFSRSVESSLGLIKTSESLRSEMLVYWEIKRALLGARDMLIRNGKELYLITSGGSLYKGVIKKAFIYRDGVLYTYEFPYPAGSIDFYEESRLVRLGSFPDFRLKAKDARGEHTNYRGIPPLVLVKLGQREWTV
ncbi:MAG: type II secretion system protein, partial [Aquificae bacterium]|nr:type II secretion system protein [Aquificota bacterium]